VYLGKKKSEKSKIAWQKGKKESLKKVNAVTTQIFIGKTIPELGREQVQL